MSKINLTPELVRIETVEWTGEKRVRFFDITGPTVEAAKSLGFVAQRLAEDGTKITDVKFGTLQAGEFRERVERRVPLIVGGFRRLASHLGV